MGTPLFSIETYGDMGIPHFHYWVSHYIPIKWLLNANFSPLFSHGFHGSSIFPWYSHSYSITYSHDIPVDGWEILHHQAWMLFQHKSWDVYHQLVQDFAGPSTVIIIVYIYIYILYHYISYSHDIPHYSYIIHPWYLFHGDITISGGNHWVPATVSLHELIAHGSHQLSATGVLAPRHGSNDLSIYLSLYIYIYMHMYICTYLLYIYICIHVCTYQSFGSIDWMMYT